MKFAVEERHERWHAVPLRDPTAAESADDPASAVERPASASAYMPPATEPPPAADLQQPAVDPASSFRLPASVRSRLPSGAARPPTSDLQPPARERLTEAQLTALWRGRRFPDGALVTRTGVPVTVVYQGRAGRGPGPDFRGAVIAGPSGLTLRGDIELHVRSSSFRAHGHATDPAYANIVLHVVFEDDTGEDTPLPGGRRAPVVALAPWVAQRAGELERWLARPLLWREPCHDAVTRMGADGAGAALDAEGDRRFEAHAARLREVVARDGLEQALYEGLLGALGYGGNAGPMLALARLLPWRVLRERADADAGRPEAGRWKMERRGSTSLEDRRSAAEEGPPTASRRHVGTKDAAAAETSSVNPPASGVPAASDGRCELAALLLGSAGLLPSQRGHRGPVEAYVEGLERAFARSGLPGLPASSWKLWGVRPANAPARRIAAAAALLDALGAPSGLLRALDATTVNEAIAPLSARAAGYWLGHFDPCAGPCRLPPAFVGRARAIEILLNVVLPAAAASSDASLAARARVLYAKLPRPAAYGATRFVENALASEGVRVPVNARRAQGLLALHRDWCTQGGCGRCPLS